MSNIHQSSNSWYVLWKRRSFFNKLSGIFSVRINMSKYSDHKGYFCFQWNMVNSWTFAYSKWSHLFFNDFLFFFNSEVYSHFKPLYLRASFTLWFVGDMVVRILEDQNLLFYMTTIYSSPCQLKQMVIISFIHSLSLGKNFPKRIKGRHWLFFVRFYISLRC